MNATKPFEAAPLDGFWAIVPAGGAGTRLWPLSRRARPKFLLDLVGTGRSLLQATVDRLAPLAGGGVLVVTGEVHAPAVRDQLPEIDPARVLAEPSPRDSMPAICWAAAVIERIDPDAVVGSFAADHVIEGSQEYAGCVAEAVAVARTGKLVTIGIQPTSPATGFGYIHAGRPLTVDGAPSALSVVEFVEKPDEATATAYLASGEFLWNAGMFVVKAAVLLDLLASYDPDAAASLRAIAAEPARLDELWSAVTKTAIDLAVAEPAAADGQVATIPANFTWDDIGDFDSLASLLPDVAGIPGLRVLGEASQVIATDATGVVATSGGRVVVVVGLADVAVIDTPDAVLVMPRGRAQDVKAVVDAVKAMGRSDLT